MLVPGICWPSNLAYLVSLRPMRKPVSKIPRRITPKIMVQQVSKLNMETKPERERNHRERSTVSIQTPGNRTAARKSDRSIEIAGNSEHAPSK